MTDPRPPHAVLVVDLQSAFAPPQWLVDGAAALARTMPSVGTIELHDETQVPFDRQLGWTPPADDRCLIAVDRVFVKRGYNPPAEAIAYLREIRVARVFVCGLQAETCVLAAGFALFDAGLTPTLIADLVAGSSLDRSGSLGVRLWRHHFRNVVERHATLLEGQTGGLA